MIMMNEVISQRRAEEVQANEVSILNKSILGEVKMFYLLNV